MPIEPLTADDLRAAQRANRIPRVPPARRPVPPARNAAAGQALQPEAAAAATEIGATDIGAAGNIGSEECVPPRVPWRALLLDLWCEAPPGLRIAVAIVAGIVLGVAIGAVAAG